jgi:hypothetical protein
LLKLSLHCSLLRLFGPKLSSSPNGTVQSEDLHIGAGADSGGAFFFSGNIDDVSIWNTALDEAAILNIKDNGVASAIPEATSLGLLALGCLGLLRRRRS